jgi:hypothetical protein
VIWTRRLAQVRGRLEAVQPPIVSGDAVDLWQRIYHTEPDPWQAEVLRSQHPRILLNCCRQSGKSSVAAVVGLDEALSRPPALVLLLSASLRQAQELGKKLFSAYRALGKPVPSEAENRLSLELSNGSRVICLPGKEGTARGYSGPKLVVLDEASRISDGLYFALRPMLSVSKGRLLCLSTPFGKRGFFYREWAQSERWEKVHITAEQCPRIPTDFLAEEKGTLPLWWYLQEYFGVFGDLQDSVFSHDDIMGAFRHRVKPLFGSAADAADEEEEERPIYASVLTSTIGALFSRR